MSQESPFKTLPLPEDSELIQKYQPRFLARGGDHLVYEVEDHPDIVLKASTYRIKDILSTNLDEAAERELEQEVYEENERVRLLRLFFGADHTIPERRYLMKVPITMDLLEAVFENDWKGRKPPEAPLDEVWTVVIVQRKVEEISDTNHLSLNFGNFVEERQPPISADKYKKLNDTFVLGRSSSETDGIPSALEGQDGSTRHNLDNVIEKAKNDPELKKKLEEFVRATIDYAQETGNILALAGEDNVILFQKDGQWNYLLVDAIPVHSEPVFALSKKTLEKVMANEPIDNHERNLLMKTLNFVRTVNGLAEFLGIDDRLDIIPERHADADIDFQKILSITK